MKKISRILQYIEEHGINTKSFEKKAGFSNGYLTNTNKRDADVSDKALKRLKLNLPDEYFKIFPEEAESKQETEEIEKSYLTECEKIKIEYEGLKKIVVVLEATIEDKNEIIALQRKLLLPDQSKDSA